MANHLGEETSDKDIKLLWANYFEDPSIENKNELLIYYLFLVRKIVLRMMPNYRSQNEYDDLISNGVIGLMDAIDKYDSMRNVKFETYASKRIQGEILDYMRKQDWISSSMRTRIKKVKQMFENLSVEFGRDPTEEEVAKRLELSPTQVKEALENEYLYSIIYFESVISSNSPDQSIKVIDTLQDDNEDSHPESHYEKREMLSILAEVLEELPENEKLVIDLYYNKEMLLKEIAQVLGVSESRVSQIHSKAIKRIQSQLAAM